MDKDPKKAPAFGSLSPAPTADHGTELLDMGILLLFLGHLVGLLTPKKIHHALGLSSSTKQAVAIVAGVLFGVDSFFVPTILLHRRLFDPHFLQDVAVRGHRDSVHPVTAVGAWLGDPSADMMGKTYDAFRTTSKVPQQRLGDRFKASLAAQATTQIYLSQLSRSLTNGTTSHSAKPRNAPATR